MDAEIIAIAYDACQEIEYHFRYQNIGYKKSWDLAKSMHIDNLDKETAMAVGKCMEKIGFRSLMYLSDKLSMISSNPKRTNILLRDFCKCLVKNMR